jgi:hypothetical protein
MATTNIFKRIFTRKKNPDWARINEPDEVAKPVVYGLFGVFIMAFSVLAAFNMLTVSPVHWVAYFLASFNSDLPFNYQLAAFGAALIVLIDLVVLTVFLMFAPADNSELADMISELDNNTQERLVELEHTFSEQLDEIKRNQ